VERSGGVLCCGCTYKSSSSHLVGRGVGVSVYFAVPLDRTSGSSLRCPHEVICLRDHQPLWYPRTLMWELTSCRVWDAQWIAFCCSMYVNYSSGMMWDNTFIAVILRPTLLCVQFQMSMDVSWNDWGNMRIFVRLFPESKNKLTIF